MMVLSLVERADDGEFQDVEFGESPSFGVECEFAERDFFPPGDLDGPKQGELFRIDDD